MPRRTYTYNYKYCGSEGTYGCNGSAKLYAKELQLRLHRLKWGTLARWIRVSLKGLCSGV
eukprot:4539362-Amphidinium_carterae.1